MVSLKDMRSELGTENENNYAILINVLFASLRSCDTGARDCNIRFLVNVTEVFDRPSTPPNSWK